MLFRRGSEEVRSGKWFGGWKVLTWRENEEEEFRARGEVGLVLHILLAV